MKQLLDQGLLKHTVRETSADESQDKQNKKNSEIILTLMLDVTHFMSQGVGGFLSYFI